LFPEEVHKITTFTEKKKSPSLAAKAGTQSSVRYLYEQERKKNEATTHTNKKKKKIKTQKEIIYNQRSALSTAAPIFCPTVVIEW